jgi:hypothetical protein
MPDADLTDANFAGCGGRGVDCGGQWAETCEGGGQEGTARQRPGGHGDAPEKWIGVSGPGLT